MAKRREERAFCVLPSHDLNADIAFYTRELSMQLLAVYPSGDPHRAELTGGGLALLLDARYLADPGLLIIKTEEAARSPLQSPSGTDIRWEQSETVATQTLANHQVEICTLRSSPWITGRAGTHTRDLIPSRLGGGIVAEHFRIPNGGPVADRVHYHTSGFQLVFCVQGWIQLAYEDQGEPVTLHPGDCVTQPPHIRHKVLETSNGLEVIEISAPAKHVTAIDNDMSLPSGKLDAERQFHGQRFCSFQQSDASWKTHRLPGFAAADTGVTDASANVAGASLLRATSAVQKYRASHTANALFSFVLAGSVRINKQLLVAGDAFTLPPHEDHIVGDISSDVCLLEVSLPGQFSTQIS